MEKNRAGQYTNAYITNMCPGTAKLASRHGNWTTMMRIIFILGLLLPLAAFPGQGRDGGWPESIHFLRLAQANLIELLALSSDQDVKDALNGMKDRSEDIRVEDVNLALIIRLVKNLENPNVEQIENSTYQGVRLFSYDNSDPANPRVFATKNFFSKERYQIPTTQINPAILKEVQTLILHEISHLWGFGEEVGDINYARIFAIRMVNILHGSMKVSFTAKEKLQLLSMAHYHTFVDIADHNATYLFDGKSFSCRSFSQQGEVDSSTDSHKLYPFQRPEENYSLRWNTDGYLIWEKTTFTFNKAGFNSYYMRMKGVDRELQEIRICHKDKDKIEQIEDNFIRPYFSRANLLSDYANSSLAVYHSLLIEDIRFLGEAFKDAMSVQRANQNQLIQNIDYKIKVENAEIYQRLTGRRYKYSRPQDSADIANLNVLLNSDLSLQDRAFWAQIINKTNKLKNDISSSKNNYNRQTQMDSFFSDYFREFNSIADRYKTLTHQGQNCYLQKNLGDYYACHLENEKLKSLARIKLIGQLLQEMDALTKRFMNRAYALRD
jgi:hypothetical protein